MRNLLMVLFAASVLLLSGCISMDTRQKVEKDGSSTITQKIDMSGLVAYAKSMNGSTGNSSISAGASFSEVCVNETRDDSTLKCTYDEQGIILMEKKVVAADVGYEFKAESQFPNTVYTFSTDTMPQLTKKKGIGSVGAAPGAGEDKPVKFADSATKGSMAMLKMANVKIDYTIEMPGELVSAENGEIKDGKAHYDVMKLIDDGQNVRVVSRELDVMAVSIVGVVALAVIGGAAYLFLGRKKSAQQPPQVPPMQPMQ